MMFLGCYALFFSDFSKNHLFFETTLELLFFLQCYHLFFS